MVPEKFWCRGGVRPLEIDALDLVRGSSRPSWLRERLDMVEKSDAMLEKLNDDLPDNGMRYQYGQ